MTVSVIIPVYNRAYIVRDAIASVFAQTWRDFELLVMDDGSRDNTWEILQQIHDSRLRTFRHARNRGISAARNTALREARGELISFLDSDDLWNSEKLKRQVRFLEAHPEADAVFTNVQNAEGAVRFPSRIRKEQYFQRLLAAHNYPEEIVFEQREMYLCLLQELPIMTSSLTVRARVARKVGEFNPSRRASEDWEYFIRLSREFRMGYIADPLTVIRVQEDSVHVKSNDAGWTAELDFLGREIELALSRADREAAAAARIGCSGSSKYLAWSHLAAGNKSEAATAFLRGFRATGDVTLIGRAVLAFFPNHIRAPLKRALDRQEN